jgi:hypothetical protein
MDGVNQAACSNRNDIPPICPHRACPAPKIGPNNKITPTGKSVCVPQRVYNVYSGKYEKREVCY